MVVTTEKLLEKLKEIEPEGLEISLRFGILSVTKAVYLRDKLVYLFPIEYDWVFNKETGVTISNFKKTHKKWYWRIDQIIS